MLQSPADAENRPVLGEGAEELSPATLAFI